LSLFTVPGGGGWAFQEVDSLLTANGARVYRPSLTGQGERVHLASPDVGLETHILDIINVILYEDLREVILLGHSYGGMVIPGVADSIPDRIRKLVYIDALVPEDGESLLSIIGESRDFKNVDGFVIPFWVPEDQAPPKDVPHSYKTLSDTLDLSNPLREEIPTTYIHTVEKGKTPQEDGFADQAQRAKKRGWPVMILESDHNAQWSAPEEFAEMLLKIAGD